MAAASSSDVGVESLAVEVQNGDGEDPRVGVRALRFDVGAWFGLAEVLN
jgi:hypothetical protein